MNGLKRRLQLLEQKLRLNLEEEPKPIGLILDIKPEDFLNHFDIISRLAQQKQLPGVPVGWLRLSEEERLETVISTCYRNEYSQLSRAQCDALVEVLRLKEQLEKGELKSKMSPSNAENGDCLLAADYVRDDKADFYSTNDGSLITHWAYELVRKAAPLELKVITCFEECMGCRFDNGYFYQAKGQAYPQPYDTGVLENTFEIVRLVVEIQKLTNNEKQGKRAYAASIETGASL